MPSNSILAILLVTMKKNYTLTSKDFLKYFFIEFPRFMSDGTRSIVHEYSEATRIVNDNYFVRIILTGFNRNLC